LGCTLGAGPGGSSKLVLEDFNSDLVITNGVLLTRFLWTTLQTYIMIVGLLLIWEMVFSDLNSEEDIETFPLLKDHQQP
jgi:hypothetical protein